MHSNIIYSTLDLGQTLNNRSWTDSVTRYWEKGEGDTINFFDWDPIFKE